MSKEKVLVTVVNSKNVPDMKKGQVLKCIKEPTNDYDKFAIVVSDGTDNIGYISSNTKTTIPGTLTNKSIYDGVGDKFDITVERMDTLVGMRTKKVIVASVMLENTGSSSSVGGDTVIIKAVVKGSSVKNTAKSKVIALQKKNLEDHNEALRTGNTKHKADVISLVAQVNSDGELAVFYNDEPAGIIDMAGGPKVGTAEQLAEIKMAVESAGELEAIVVGTPDVARYTVEFALTKASMKEAAETASKKVLETTRDELEAKGFDPDVISNIEDILLNSGLSANHIKQWFSTFEQYPTEEAALIPKWEDVQKYVDNQGHVKLAVGAILKGKHLNLIGEKGTGKNTFADYILYLAQRPKHELSGNGQTSKAEFFGEPTIESEVTDAGEVAHKIEFNPEQFVQAMGYKETDDKRHAGGCALIDEANGIPADVLLSLNSSADARKAVTVPGYGRVNAGKNFFIMLTMNIGYEGTRNLNEAFKDRFVPIRFDSNDSIEQILVSNCPMAKKSDVQKANKIYQKMNSLIRNNDGELDSSCITIRGFIDALDLVEFVGLKEALIINVADRILDDDDYRKKTIDIIESIVG